MRPNDEFVISVTAAWNDWRSADARLGDLREVHWHQPKGAPHSMIHAYVLCGDIVRGALSHYCDPSSVPHRVRVCVLKSHNILPAYGELVRRAEQTTTSSGAPFSTRCVSNMIPAAPRA